MEGPTLSKMEAGRLRMKYLFPRGVIDILKKSVQSGSSCVI